MGKVIKAGVPHVIKVNTKADKMGCEAGFKVHYFDDATREYVEVPNTFFEFEKTLTQADRNAGQAIMTECKKGEKVINVKTAAGFEAGDTVKIDGNYYRVADTTPTTVILKKGLVEAVRDGNGIYLSGRTGTYGISITFPKPGNYTLHITNFAIGMDNVPAPIEVAAADIDDVKVLLDSVGDEVSKVKTQVDLLDETELNGITQKVDSLSSELSALHTLIKDSTDATMEFRDDVTSYMEDNDTLTGQTSSATGIVKSKKFNKKSKITTVTLESVTGSFQTNETVIVSSTSLDIDIVAVHNNTTNSVVEFVKDIQDLLSSGTGLDALSKLNKDLEHMVNGDATLEDGSVCPTAGKGLSDILDTVNVSEQSIKDDIAKLVTNVNDKFSSLSTAVSDSRTSLESKLIALNDTSDSNSLASKLNAIKTIVDANKSTLGNSVYGLQAIVDLVNANNTSVSNDLTSIADNVKNGNISITASLQNIEDVVNTTSTSLLDAMTKNQTELLVKLEDMHNANNFDVFA